MGQSPSSASRGDDRGRRGPGASPGVRDAGGGGDGEELCGGGCLPSLRPGRCRAAFVAADSSPAREAGRSRGSRGGRSNHPRRGKRRVVAGTLRSSLKNVGRRKASAPDRKPVSSAQTEQGRDAIRSGGSSFDDPAGRNVSVSNLPPKALESDGGPVVEGKSLAVEGESPRVEIEPREEHLATPNTPPAKDPADLVVSPPQGSGGVPSAQVSQTKDPRAPSAGDGEAPFQESHPSLESVAREKEEKLCEEREEGGVKGDGGDASPHRRRDSSHSIPSICSQDADSDEVVTNVDDNTYLKEGSSLDLFISNGVEQAADSALAWGALGIILGAPAPVPPEGKKRKAKLWQPGDDDEAAAEDLRDVVLVTDDWAEPDIPSTFPEGAEPPGDEHVVPDIMDDSGDLVLPAPVVTPKSIVADVADSALAWTALAGLLGSPAPSSVIGRSVVDRRLDHWGDGEGTDVLPEVCGEENSVPDDEGIGGVEFVDVRKDDEAGGRLARPDEVDSSWLPDIQNGPDSLHTVSIDPDECVDLHKESDSDEGPIGQGGDNTGEGRVAFLASTATQKVCQEDKGKSSTKNLWRDWEGSDLLSEIDGEEGADSNDEADPNCSIVSFDRDGLLMNGREDVGIHELPRKREGGKAKGSADSALTWGAMGMLIGSSAPTLLSRKACGRSYAKYLWDNGGDDPAEENDLDGLLALRLQDADRVVDQAHGKENEPSDCDDSRPALSGACYEEGDDTFSIPSLSETSDELGDSNRSPLTQDGPYTSGPNKEGATDSFLAWGALAAIVSSPASKVVLPARRRRGARGLWGDDDAVDGLKSLPLD